MSIVVLKIPENNFWRMTPRKFKALTDIHLIVKGVKQTEEQKAEKKKADLNWLKARARKV
jgi:hypothetical protein